MGLLLQYKELFEPYTVDGHTLENTLKYLAKQAAQHNIPSEVMELAVNDIFSRVASGYEYPKDKCPCGCGIDKAGTAITHAMLARMFEIDKDNAVALSGLMQKRYALLVENEMKKISKTNKEYIKMNQPPLSERSPVLRGIKRLWTSLR